MKPSESNNVFKSFKDLKSVLEKESLPIQSFPSSEKPAAREIKIEPENDNELFMDAMADVTPLTGNTKAEIEPRERSPVSIDDDADQETLSRLESLVKHGKGFVVAQTPEYIEGAGYRVHPHVIRRLHRGDFSIQAHIDLHGLTAVCAREAFENFLKTTIQIGNRAVLIVHGRGLSSPSEPVLKTKVCEWLTCGPWRKWVIAFSSARPCDGGAGATYVLLRKRPFTKSQKKRKRSP